jgi:NTP pyrophosphatase (non-canonical NTP hydrolase)|tara:strand:- start:1707 stop:1979 length:273 start_codon:yes stop_codon:yes gene_type:complete
MEKTYGLRDSERGLAATVAWLTEELGELAQAVRKGTPEQQLHEIGDVLAWVASLAAQLDLSLEEAVSRYANGCPRCQTQPCGCPDLSIGN